ncbi:hypothetical protein AXF14_03395 [Actinomyces radicidentis]|uniref:Lipoprotein n=1 Tax=Actinomyces radicidentis TaxID=111015 RepID=A0A0X8JDX2_ACTRD|nr:hypothetical protein [Actinomyces radicidentis]AMD86819.1 hypothetical protein AXF14_03395 [Actinomyces radicidentis]
MTSQKLNRALALPAVATLSLSALAACSHDSSDDASASATSSSAAVTVTATATDAQTTAPAVEASSAPATESPIATGTETQTPLAKGTEAAGEAPSPSLEAAQAVWSTAGQAIIDGDESAFLSVSSQSVLDELTTEQKAETGPGDTLSWKHWDVMGGHDATASQDVKHQVGSCVEGTGNGVTPPEGTSVTCEIDAVPTGSEPMPMGYFFLGQQSDGSYTVLGYQRNYQ